MKSFYRLIEKDPHTTTIGWYAVKVSPENRD